MVAEPQSLSHLGVSEERQPPCEHQLQGSAEFSVQRHEHDGVYGAACEDEQSTDVV